MVRVLFLLRCWAISLRCVAGGVRVSLSLAHSHTKYGCFGIHVQRKAASVIERRRRWLWSLMLRVCGPLFVSRSLKGFRVRRGIFLLWSVGVLYTASIWLSFIQPPSSCPQVVHVMKQREAFRTLQAVGNQMCQDPYDCCLSLRRPKLEIRTQDPLHGYPSGVLSKDGSNSCSGPMSYHWTPPTIHDSML